MLSLKMIILKEHMKRSFRDLWKQIWRKYPDTDLIHTVKVQNRKSGRRANVRRQMFIS